MRIGITQTGLTILGILIIPSLSRCQETLTYNQDIAPIFAESCYQCHGPDESQNESGFRLDTKSSAFKKLESGKFAIDKNRPMASEILNRILATDGSQMPPTDSNYSISKNQIAKISAWIEQGAKWDSHWAFEPLKTVPIPNVADKKWPNNSIDYFVLSKLEANHLRPAVQASPSILRRRVFTDVVGIIPENPLEGQLNFETLVNQLLASPRFGEKWARHWLDVARYADSNGADENHYYPNAFYYRDWVIDAMNSDLPFDQFVSHQLAGDLLATDENPEPLAATGFLAIGIKILAEKDPVKKRMDMIDEQLDTLGQSFLGLTIGCARCHDHKFDPIPTKDYYALAGILHSTEVVDQYLFSKSLAEKKKQVDAVVTSLSRTLEEKKKSLETEIGTASFIARQAEKFDRGNVVVDNSNYGKGIGIISDPGAQENFAEYDFEFRKKKTFLLQLRYSAKHARPGRILVNGNVAIDNAISKTTGSWMPDTQTWFTEGRIEFEAGENKLRIESKPLMSHIDQFRLIEATQENSIQEDLKTISELEQKIKVARAQMPMARKVMAVKDGTTNDIPIHLRGSHLELGDKVTRGFLTRIGNKDLANASTTANIPKNSSGRKELANWLTQPQSPPSQMVARVIVNRVWHWYFGQGLVDSPNEFGIRGATPSHPELLDYLAHLLIDSDWSLKAVHREILLSKTYQMASRPRSDHYRVIDPANRLLSFHPIKRMTAEVYRDSILLLRGDLDLRMKGAPPQVTSQDPSPEKLDANQRVYDSSRRRSVYLPIIRSNTYDLFVNFDFPDASATNGQRTETIVPTQALLLMNGQFVANSSARMAGKLNRESKLSLSKLHEKIFGVKPNAETLKILAEYADDSEADDSEADDSEADDSEAENLQLLIHTLLMSNDFIYVK